MRAIAILVAFAALAIGGPVNAETVRPQQSKEEILGYGVAISGTTLLLNQRSVTLFGVTTQTDSPQQAAAARKALDGILSRGLIRCSPLPTQAPGILATCSAFSGGDVAIALLRSGAVSVLPAQVVASPLEAPYFTAEAVAREAQLGLWGNDRPSTQPTEALDKIAKALATPPDPVPTDSIFWYLYPWQSAITGIFSLAGALGVWFSAKHQAKEQIRSVQMQIAEDRRKESEANTLRKRQILLTFNRKISAVIEDCNVNIEIINSSKIFSRGRFLYRISELVRMNFNKTNSIIINDYDFIFLDFEISDEVSTIINRIRDCSNAIDNIVAISNTPISNGWVSDKKMNREYIMEADNEYRHIESVSYLIGVIIENSRDIPQKIGEKIKECEKI